MGSGSGTHDLGPLGAEPIASGGGRARDQAASDAAGAAWCRLSGATSAMPSPAERSPGAAPATPVEHGTLGGVAYGFDAGRVEQHAGAVAGAVDVKHRGHSGHPRGT
jgi:hypothetical protein